MTDNTIDGLKQRLVGAFVILSLAVIFVPMIFDQPHTAGKATIVPVPPKPELEPVAVQKPEKPNFERIDIDAKDAKIKVVSKIAAANAEPKASTASMPEPAVTKDTAKQSASEKQDRPEVSNLPIFKNVWMVQLGTFSKRDNAYGLRDQLRKDGFDGHAKDVEIDGKKAVRVFTGPFVNKREAARVKKKVDAKYKVDSLLIHFEA